MTVTERIERKTTHGTFTSQRIYPASPARVFKAFADREAKAKWFTGPQGIDEAGREFDFRVDGREVAFGRHANNVVTGFFAIYQDIVPDERIVFAYRMTMDGLPISASLTTIEIAPHGDGARLVWTEYGVYLDGFDKPALREEGTNWLLDRIGQSLAD
jgi:uncharacterized protein YndB with AHSA1/START domain